MELFIQIRDGQPYQHPIFGDNFREAFPHIDPDNLPPEFARFERVACPDNAGKLEKNVVSYQWVNGVVKDVWSTVALEGQELEERIAMLTESAYATVNVLKQNADEIIASTVGDEQQAWIDFKAALDAWVLIDPTMLKLPAMPRYLEDGTLVTANTSGSAPNVIE